MLLLFLNDPNVYISTTALGETCISCLSFEPLSPGRIGPNNNPAMFSFSISYVSYAMAPATTGLAALFPLKCLSRSSARLIGSVSK